jgi:hypothetical protein
MVNASLLADNRLARAQLGSSDTIASFHAALEDAIGTATEAGSLGSLLTAFDAAVVSAAARPDSDVRLSAVSTPRRRWRKRSTASPTPFKAPEPAPSRRSPMTLRA